MNDWRMTTIFRSQALPVATAMNQSISPIRMTNRWRLTPRTWTRPIPRHRSTPAFRRRGNRRPGPPQIRKDIVVKLPSILKPRQIAPPPPKELGEYTLPPWDFLADPEHGYSELQERFVREKAAILEQALREFSIDAQVVEIDTGPVITMYELSLAPGVKVSAISALSNDIQRALKAETVRIVAPIPGKSTVGIEVPNEQKEKVRMKELLQLAPEAMQKMAIPLFLGKDASGEPLIADMASMPHCLIAGHHRLGKIGLHQHDHHVDHVHAAAGRGEADSGRSEGRRNGALQGGAAPDVPRHQRCRPGDERARMGLHENGRALRSAGRGGRAKHQGIQQPDAGGIDRALQARNARRRSAAFPRSFRIL